jgi:hypothetical protein
MGGSCTLQVTIKTIKTVIDLLTTAELSTKLIDKFNIQNR